jgi:chorismate synthase
VLEGLPSGVPLTSAEIARELARRRLGYGRGKRMRFEADRLEVLGGLRHGRTLGSPLAIRIDNSEWPKWTQVMAPDPVEDPEAVTSGKGVPLTRPRPGHADLTGMQSTASTRPGRCWSGPAPRRRRRVAAGAAARPCRPGRVRCSATWSGSGRRPPGRGLCQPWPTWRRSTPRRPLPGREAGGRMAAAVDAARRPATPSAGCSRSSPTACPGLGSYVHWDRKLDARLAGA